MSHRVSLPLVTPLDGSLPAWEAFRRLAHLPGVVFLDSAAQEPARGRYSYIVGAPFETIRARGGSVEVVRPASPDLNERGEVPVAAGELDPFRTLASRLAAWRTAEVPGLPPFQGGAIGVFGYGLSRSVERLPPPRRDDLPTPDLAVELADWVVAHDHSLGTAVLVAQGFPGLSDSEREARARQRTEEILALLAAPPRPHAPLRSPALEREKMAPSFEVPGHPQVLSNFTPQGYVNAVAAGIEAIRAGDLFQVNLSQRLLHALEEPPLEIYRKLRERNPAPYAGYMDLGEATILSSSPEQFLSLSGPEVITRPIKGTRPRGYTPEADSYGSEALRESEKDRAENVMIVDLLRNDLSRVCRPGTVLVPRLFELERHPTVHHLVSEVRGVLKEGLGAVDLLRATFPGGSVTGAPKVRAMEIIAELEPTARGPYCGSLGWIAFHGGMGLNILIRTLTASRGWLQLPVGGGVVALSNPEVEYQETLHKAAGMLRALQE